MIEDLEIRCEFKEKCETIKRIIKMQDKYNADDPNFSTTLQETYEKIVGDFCRNGTSENCPFYKKFNQKKQREQGNLGYFS